MSNQSILLTSDNKGGSSKKTLMVFVVMLLLAISIRMYHIMDPPLGHHKIRQYRSVLIANWFYYELSPTDDAVLMDVFRTHHPPILEPPIVEAVAAGFYWLLDNPHVGIARLLSVFYWTIGAIFFFRIARLLFTDIAVLFASFFYLFLPYLIITSRSFQPEPLLMMMILISVYYSIQYIQNENTKFWFLATMTAGLAILIKPVALFMLWPTLLFMALRKYGLTRQLLQPKHIVYLIFSLVPALIYYLFGMMQMQSIQGQPGLQFRPELLLHSKFWIGWLHQIGYVTGYIPFALGLIGLMVMPKSLAKSLCLGASLGYLALGLVFNQAMHTHNYYQLPYLPFMILAVSYFVTKWFLPYFSVLKLRYLIIALVCIIMCIALPLTYLVATDQWKPFYSKHKEKIWFAGSLFVGHPDIKQWLSGSSEFIALANEMKQHMDNKYPVIIYSGGYYRPLMYHMEVLAGQWRYSHPARILTTTQEVEEKMNHILSIRDFKYFLFTRLSDYQKRTALKQYLDTHYTVLVDAKDYVLYDLKSPL